MALVDRSSAAAPSGVDILAALSARFDRWLEHRRTLSALQALDDRTLADFGYTRSGLAGLAREATEG